MNLKVKYNALQKCYFPSSESKQKKLKHAAKKLSSPKLIVYLFLSPLDSKTKPKSFKFDNKYLRNCKKKLIIKNTKKDTRAVVHIKENDNKYKNAKEQDTKVKKGSIVKYVTPSQLDTLVQQYRSKLLPKIKQKKAQCKK